MTRMIEIRSMMEECLKNRHFQLLPALASDYQHLAFDSISNKNYSALSASEASMENLCLTLLNNASVWLSYGVTRQDFHFIFHAIPVSLALAHELYTKTECPADLIVDNLVHMDAADLSSNEVGKNIFKELIRKDPSQADRMVCLLSKNTYFKTNDRGKHYFNYLIEKISDISNPSDSLSNMLKNSYGLRNTRFSKVYEQGLHF